MATDALFDLEHTPVARVAAGKSAPLERKPDRETGRHDVSDGCPDDSSAHWRGLFEGADRERTRVHDLWMREITTRAREHRDTYAGAERNAWELVLWNLHRGFGDRAAGDIGYLSRCLADLPDKLSPVDIHRIRNAAGLLRDHMDKFSAAQPDGVLGELERIRKVVYEQGRRLHLEYGISNGERCGCPGCELTRAVETEPWPKED